MFRLAGDRDELGLIRHPRDRFEGNLRVGGVSRDARENLPVVNLPERRGPDRIVWRCFGDGPERLLIAETVECRRGIAVGFGRRIGYGDQPIDQLATERVVAFRPREPGEITDDGDSVDGGAPYPHILVRGRKFGDDAPTLGVVWQLRHAGEPDGRVGIAVLRLWLEAVEERHGSLASIGCSRVRTTRSDDGAGRRVQPIRYKCQPVDS